MKEKIKDHLMMVDKYASTLDSDIECHADEIMELINQEVEKRIAERMPSFDDLDARLTEYLVGILDSVDFHEWLCSRLTPQVPPQDTHQVQKEGGEG